MRTLASTLAIALAAVLLAATAYANVYKNPAHGFAQGDVALGLSLESMNRDFESEGLGDTDIDIDRTDLNVNIGVGPSGALELTLGSITGSISELPGDADGAEWGVRYRHNLDPDGGDLQRGFFASYRYAYLEDDDDNEYDLYQWDVGFGASKVLENKAKLYFGGVYSEATLDVTVAALNGEVRTADAADIIGAFGGIEFAASDQATIGAELHMLHETGFGFYVDFAL